MLEILGKVGFDWPVALANLINFIVIFLILKKFAFGPIQKLISERQQKIKEGLANAEKAEQDLLSAEKMKEAKMAEARQKANLVVSQAQDKGDLIIERSKIESEKIKDKIIKEGEQAAADAKQKIRKDLEKEMSGVIIKGVEKILQENLTIESQKQYIKKSLATYQTK